MHDPNAAQTEPRYAWVMVALTPVFMALGVGSLLCVSVFLKPLQAEFGWARGSTAFAYLAGTVAMGLGGWQGGYFYDLTGTYTWSFAAAALAGMVRTYP
jgi:hypothetical protein